jgi:acetyl-CoA acyltransferase
MRAFIVDALRSPMARAGKGAFARLRPDDLAAALIEALLARQPAALRERIDDVLAATAFPEAEQGMNLGRVLAQRAQLADRVAGMTLNRFCASGLEAVAMAHAKIESGMADAVLAVGVESMSKIPMGGHVFTPNPQIAATRPGFYLGMGLTAENLARKYKISRTAQDEFALQSHRRAVAAQSAGHWAPERIAISVDGNGTRLDSDEPTRAETSLEALAALKPAFREGGSVTAGNSSPLTDGAACVLLASERLVQELSLSPLGRLVSYAVTGVDPEFMGIGPVEAVPLALARAGWRADAVETIELNEAFAAQALAVMAQLKLDPERTNPLGGAIALGHPLGCSGARLTGTLLHHMRRQKQRRGLVTLCVGGGMGAAATFEAA